MATGASRGDEALRKTLGHEEGSKRVEEFLRWCRRLDIKVVTLYGFLYRKLQPT